MSKLLQRLSDPAKSGVYRASHDRDIRAALAGSAHDLATVTLAPGKDAMLAAIAATLDFPAWFGGNWDALEDCLCDLSWRDGIGRVVFFANARAGDEFGVLCDVLGSVAEHWRERGQPFFAVFIDSDAQLALPDLYKQRPR